MALDLASYSDVRAKAGPKERVGRAAFVLAELTRPYSPNGKQVA
jgi:hypothetical protein